MQKFICIFIISLLFYPLLSFAEQKVVKRYEQASWGGSAPFLEHDCSSYCSERSVNVDSYLQAGWRVMGIRDTEIYINPFKRNSYCRCTGAEYILER